jgi:monooxygenase
VTTKYCDDVITDVVIVGAGLSGIGAAYHLQNSCPGKSYTILESRDAMGGTWDLFRYPGIRSDSDMHTLGYRFKPWREEKAIADGPSILNYVKETATENNIDQHIRYGRRVTKASWSSEDASWTVETLCTDTGDIARFKCNFLLMCAGYYSYESGHTPSFSGRERFKGPIVHPQEWPENFDYRGKKIVVIGSGATAVTLVPELAKTAGHVVMLQRSPTYFLSLTDKDTIANILQKILPDNWAYAITRWKNIFRQQAFYRLTRSRPEKMKLFLLKMAQKELGSDYDINTHFTPSYNPWDQRLCIVPNNDLFKAINSGRASVVTGHIDRFNEEGVELTSEETVEADIVVTATGLNLIVLGGTEFDVDGKAVEFPKTYTYKGMMCSGVPNLISTFGYINASWTLHADLIAEHACKLINHMDKTGLRQCTPQLRDEDQDMPKRPWIEGFSSGYIQRALHLLPKQGSHEPWTNPQDYKKDKQLLRKAPIEDGVLIFSNPQP